MFPIQLPHKKVEALEGNYPLACETLCPERANSLGDLACQNCPGLFISQNSLGNFVATCPITDTKVNL